MSELKHEFGICLYEWVAISSIPVTRRHMIIDLILCSTMSISIYYLSIRWPASILHV